MACLRPHSQLAEGWDSSLAPECPLCLSRLQLARGSGHGEGWNHLCSIQLSVACTRHPNRRCGLRIQRERNEFILGPC